MIAAAGLLAGLFTALRRYYAFREARWTETKLRERLFGHIMSLHIGYHDRSQTGQLMSRASSDLQQIQAFGLHHLLERMNLNDMVIAQSFGTFATLMAFVIPLLCMRAFAEERATGSIELLLTSPVSGWEVVIGKYLAVLAMVGAHMWPGPAEDAEHGGEER